MEPMVERKMGKMKKIDIDVCFQDHKLRFTLTINHELSQYLYDLSQSLFKITDQIDIALWKRFGLEKL